MAKRAEAVEETRRRIIEASLSLHLEKGVLATSWQDIAKRADVAVGTVYYHFPSYDELVPACSSLGIALSEPPGAEIFQELRTRSERLRRLVRELFAYYERGRSGFELTLREMDRVPALARLAEEQGTYLRDMAREALGPGVKKDQLAVVEALIDFPMWLSLTQRGIRKEGAIKIVTHFLACAKELK